MDKNGPHNTSFDQDRIEQRRGGDGNQESNNDNDTNDHHNYQDISTSRGREIRKKVQQQQ
jgi:hypothetical protein